MTKLYKSTLMAATLAMALTSAQGRTVAVVGSIMDSNSNGSIYQITSDGDKSLMTAATDAYSNYYSASGGGTYNDAHTIYPRITAAYIIRMFLMQRRLPG